MEDTDCGLQVRIAQILVEVRQVRRHHQALVGQCAVRQATDIEFGVVGHVPLSVAAANKQRDGEFLLGFTGGNHKHLLNPGQTVERHRPKAAVVRWHLPPTHDFQALLCQALFHGSTAGSGLVLVRVKEYLTHSEQLFWLFTKFRFGGLAQKGIRALDQEATTIAGLPVCSDTTTVGHAGQ